MTAVVALDTSTLMTPVEAGVRPFDELERLLGATKPVTVPAVVAELERLAGGSGDPACAARVGADLAAERCRLVEAPAETDSADGDEDRDGHGGDATGRSEGDADDALVALARSGTVDYVATNDRPLADRVLAAGVPVIGLRGRNKLGITRP